MNNKTPIFWDESYAKAFDYRDLSKSVLTKIFNAKKNITSFLDLGSGTGGLMRKLEEKNITSSGVEWSKEAIKLAIERGTKGKIYEGNLDEIENLSLPEKFDIISIKLVLAFISNRAYLLNWCKEHLNPGGIVVINTPVISKTKFCNKPGIAIKEEEVNALLKMAFNKVELVDIEEALVSPVHTYFCS